MSWLFSRALVEAFSEATSSDGARFALLSGSHTPPLFLPSDRTTAFSRLSRFGMTFGHLTDELGADVLMWCQAASRARTSASQEKAPASPESAAECGVTWPVSLATFDPVSCSWKTAQLSLLGDLELSSVTWPRSGMTADGLCWELPMSAPPISATGSGLWPTPVASDTSSRTAPYAQGGTPLSLAVKKWPTPTTPAGNCVGRLDEWGGSRSREVMRTLVTPEELGGPLNPPWVEWLMGWPLGWTDLKPLATDRCQPAPQPRGECLPHEVAA